MRAARSLFLTLVLVAGLAGVASAQTYDNTPGTYEVAIGVVPAALPPGSLPGDLPSLGPDLYKGTLVIVRNADQTYSVSFQGQRYEGTESTKAKLTINATFDSDWAGYKTGVIPVGTSAENVITGIDGANLLSANINGVGTVDNAFQRVIAKFSGDGSTYPPALTQFKVVNAPGYLR